MPITDISQQLDRLAAFDSGPYPVISLYLNMQPDQHGRDNFEPFLRKEMADRVRTYGAEGPERKSLEQDVDKIRDYVKQVEPSANGLAIIACSGAEIFEAVPLSAPIPEHRLYISDYPHLYPLARLVDDYPKFVVLLADTHSARIFVVAGNAVEQTQHVESPKTRRHKMGGWSQARYQRHIENYHLHHAKEVIDTLARVVRDEGIASIILAGDEVIVPLLKDQLPKELAEKIVDSVKLDIRAPEHDVLAAAMATMRDKDAHSDRERVDALLDAYRSNGLAVVGAEDTRLALEMGQVDELVITGTPDAIDVDTTSPDAQGAQRAERSPAERTADELIVKARQTAARITVVQDASLLAGIGGVGALLRFKL